MPAASDVWPLYTNCNSWGGLVVDEAGKVQEMSSEATPTIYEFRLSNGTKPCSLSIGVYQDPADAYTFLVNDPLSVNQLTASMVPESKLLNFKSFVQSLAGPHNSNLDNWSLTSIRTNTTAEEHRDQGVGIVGEKKKIRAETVSLRFECKPPTPAPSSGVFSSLKGRFSKAS